MSKVSHIVNCPSCKTSFIYESVETRPFCSERCQSQDFIAWTTEQHIIPSKEALSEEDIEIVLKNKSENYE